MEILSPLLLPTLPSLLSFFLRWARTAHSLICANRFVLLRHRLFKMGAGWDELLRLSLTLLPQVCSTLTRSLLASVPTNFFVSEFSKGFASALCSTAGNEVVLRLYGGWEDKGCTAKSSWQKGNLSGILGQKCLEFHAYFVFIIHFFQEHMGGNRGDVHSKEANPDTGVPAQNRRACFLGAHFWAP